MSRARARLTSRSTSFGPWISRPLRSLITAAHGIGTGHPDARADQGTGPRQVREVAQAFNDMASRVSTLLGNQRGMTADYSWEASVRAYQQMYEWAIARVRGW